MSRSHRKQPRGGNTCAESERKDKRIWHGRMRARERMACRAACAGADLDEIESFMPQVKSISDPWVMSKDGKAYRGDVCDKELLRKTLKK